MYKVTIFGRSFDKLKIDESRGCIDLYAERDFTIKPNQVFMLNYEYLVKLDTDVLAVPYSKDRKFNLYYPNGFGVIRGYQPHLRLSLSGKGYEAEREVKQGEYIATYRFMTTQFHQLMSAGKDKGLRSAFIKIELSNEKFIENCYE